MLTIDTSSPTPLTDQIADGLRDAIASGLLQPGDPLPAIRQLAADLRIHFNTIARAYRALEADGLVHSARGRGTHVAASRTAGAGASGSEPRARLRDALVRVRLDGVDRSGVEQLLRDELARLWPQDQPTPNGEGATR